MPKPLNSLPGHKKVEDPRLSVGKNIRARRRIQICSVKCRTWKLCSRINRATTAKTQRGNRNRICILAPNLSLLFLSTPLPKETLKSKRLFSNSRTIVPHPKMTADSAPEPSHILGMSTFKRSRHRFMDLNSKNCRRNIRHQGEKILGRKINCWLTLPMHQNIQKK